MINILDFIPYGKENAVTRRELVLLTGMSDRVVRDAIARARQETPILNLQDGSGYYRPRKGEIKDLKDYVMQEESRAKSIFLSLKSARRAVKRMGG